MGNNLALWLGIVLSGVGLLTVTFTVGKTWGGDRGALRNLSSRVKHLEDNMVTKSELAELEKRIKEIQRSGKQTARWGHRTNNLAMEILALLAQGSPREVQINEIIRRHRRDAANEEDTDDG